MAEMIRTSTGISLEPPILRKFRSSRKRSSFACIPTSMSPISSRNTVPPSASSKSPFLAVLASVKAPFSWPNSSLSRRVEGTAAQLMATNGFSARADS